MALNEQSSIRLLVCTPDSESADAVRAAAEKLEAFIQPVRCFQTLFSLESYLADTVRGSAEIVVLSADFPELKSFEAAVRLWKMFPHLLILFTSADLNKTVPLLFTETRPYAPFGLLRVPFGSGELQKNLEQAVEAVSLNIPRCFILKTQFGLASVRFSRILYAESEKRIVHIYLTNGLQYDSYIKMDVLEQAMPQNFMRIHQSFLVNLDYAQMISDNNLVLSNSRTLPISRNYKASLKERLFMLKGC